MNGEIRWRSSQNRWCLVTDQSTPTLILEAVVKALIASVTTVSLSASTCYPVIQPAYIEGQDPTVLQVWIGGSGPADTAAGKGAQEGGGLLRKMQVGVTVWRRVLLDKYANSQIALTEEGTGMNALTAQVMAPFKYTYLGGLLFEPMWWSGDTGAQWYDEEAGLIRKDVMYDVSFGEVLPTTLTLT